MARWLVIFLVTLGYLLVSLLVGILSGRRTSGGTEGYVAGDRSLGFLVLYFIMGASIFSAFAFLGGPGWAYSRGAAAFYILAYGTLGLVPWYFFGPRISRLGRKFGYVTQAELFAHRFQSRSLSGLLALISLVAFIPYLTLQMQGAGYVFSVVTEGRVPEWAGAAIAYGVVLTYVFVSGVMGVAWTNTFQGIFMMALAWGLGLYLPAKLYGGVGPMFNELAGTVPEMLRAPGLAGSGSPWSWGGYSSAIAISVLGFGVWPHYFMKIYTAQSVRTLKRTVVFYPTFQIFLVPILLIGFSGILRFPGVEPADAILPTIVTSIGLPAVVVGLFCAGALAASMSTGDALVHAAASVMVKDFYAVLF
ncbi:MAG: sodium:solute symporter, partial [Nitrospinota bacterium]